MDFSQIMKYLSRAYWHRKYISCLKRIGSKRLIWEKTKQLYFAVTGKWLNYNNPKDLNEKLMWLTRFDNNPLKTVCADKYLVKQYLAQNGMAELVVPLIDCWDSADDVDFLKLPNQFVLKCNHGSGYNIICLDKSKMNYDDVRSELAQWMEEDYSEKLYEIHYKNIPRKILAEPLLCDVPPVEYQFWCLNGEPDSILVCRKNYDGTYDAGSYSLEWNRLNDRKNENTDVGFLPPPMGVNVLAEFARRLAKPFPFVRVDFYVVDESVYLAEMTFTPSANLLVNYKQSFLDRLGEKLILPE